MSGTMSEVLEPLTLVSRKTWGALDPKGALGRLECPVAQVVVHWGTDTDPCETTDECIKIVESIQKSHMEEKGLDDIAYNFLIGGDGKAYAGRGWEWMPHALVYPEIPTAMRIDIAYIGRDWGRGNIPWDMLKAALQLLGAGVDSKLLMDDYSSTEHPVEVLDEEPQEE